MLTFLAIALLASGSGCAPTQWVRVREMPANPLAGPLNLLSPSGPQPTPRTMLLVRRYNLQDEARHLNVDLLAKLQEINQREPGPEKLYSLAELSYLAGKRAEALSKQRALELHGMAVVNAYHYLFDDRFGQYRNPYDPQFRGACDLYNGALESALRIIKRQGGLQPGTTHTIQMAHQTVETTIVLCGQNWRPDDFEDFLFVSDYEIRGLQNQYHNYGLGVPLIAVRKHRPEAGGEEKFYPPGMSYPVTAFLRVREGQAGSDGRHVAQLELHDPLCTSEIHVGRRLVPLENDLTTPLAYALNQKELQDLDASTVGFLNPAKTDKLRGLYMLEPYQPGKIPVLMIHGVWSSPITWMAMFNDLRGTPEIRDRYQFWFYLYPSGQPFWHSAAQLRADLAEARRTIDPTRSQPALDQMVLVGHSMGGLVARLQTLDSGNDFWNIVSREPFQLVKASPQTKQELAETFFFTPNPSIRRVVTIGTPFRGSQFANDTTRWLGSKLIKLPQMIIRGTQELYRENPELDPTLLSVNTSIDALAPESPILPVMLRARTAPWVVYHNIIGEVPDRGLLGRVAGDGDGVVSSESAHVDDVQSEVTVPADHTTVHSHSLSVLEVRRVLLEHLAAIDVRPRDRITRLPETTAALHAKERQPAAGVAWSPGIPLTSPGSAAPAVAEQSSR